MFSEAYYYSLGNNDLSRPGIYQYISGAMVCTLYSVQSTVWLTVCIEQYGLQCEKYSMAYNVHNTALPTMCRVL